jgi:surface-adhesin protein E
MWQYPGILAMAAVVGINFFASTESAGQTPAEAEQWEQQRAQARADEQARTAQLSREREARRADPMAWVRTLDPMLAGGWEFRAVAADGSWATYSTNHQMKRAGSQVTVWLRQEYAEPQAGDNGKYLSVVEKIQYDCAKDRARPLLVIYYAGNNIQGSEQTEEADAKTAVWNSIVPGTRDEFNYRWACGAGKPPAPN